MSFPARAVSSPGTGPGVWSGTPGARMDLWISLGRQRPPAAMTVAPSSSSNRAPLSTAPAPLSPEPSWLGEELARRVTLAAAASGMTVAAVCEQWVREGVERFEAHRPAEDPDHSGRCSLRTGTHSAGPVPLPVQQ